jgi:hypothetical protein
MRLLNQIQSESSQPKSFQVFRGPEDEFAIEASRIKILINAWLMSQDGSRCNSHAASRIERKLHDRIKAGPLHCKILSFAGLNFWVDDQTSDGLVIAQESINL